ncbi:MAG: hypothetical protein IPK94_05790 [Saprospiraceae bacterium]|nr:hypothetical protein [Saprospiraceae bacterium]
MRNQVVTYHEDQKRCISEASPDPARRGLFLEHFSGTDIIINAVAENFNKSRPAVSKHVKVLSECGSSKSNNMAVSASAKQNWNSSEVSAWIDQYKQFWKSKLDAPKSISIKFKKIIIMSSNMKNTLDPGAQEPGYYLATDRIGMMCGPSPYTWPIMVGT